MLAIRFHTAAVALAVCLAGGSLAEPVSPLSAQVRELARAQDAVARGDEGSVRQLRTLLSRLPDGEAAAQRTWDPTARNTSAMLTLVLSGGDPAAAETYAKTQGLPERDAVLIRGSAHFMRGMRTEAAAELDQIEIDSLAVMDRGRVAMAKAMLLPDEDARKLPLLRVAMAAMPGSLVEEAALRRAAISAANGNDAAATLAFAGRYARRFSASPYAPEFMQALARSISEFEAKSPRASLERLQASLAALPLAHRRNFYILLIRQAIAARNLDLVRWAATRVRQLAPGMSPEMTRAALYDYACAVVDGGGAANEAGLNAINIAMLRGDEVFLLQAAKSVAREIQRPAGEIANLLTAPDRSSIDATVLAAADAALQSASAALADGAAP